MGLANRIFGEKRSGISEGYIDLEKYVESTHDDNAGAKMHVGIGMIQRYEDIKKMKDYIYGGNVLILDFSQLSDEEVILKRITTELKRIADDINGDIAGIGNNLMIVAPQGVKIDRRKIKANFA